MSGIECRCRERQAAGEFHLVLKLNAANQPCLSLLLVDTKREQGRNYPQLAAPQDLQEALCLRFGVLGVKTGAVRSVGASVVSG